VPNAFTLEGPFVIIPAIERAELKGGAVSDTTLMLALAVVNIAAIATRYLIT
jgi:hypothetical protein